MTRLNETERADIEIREANGSLSVREVVTFVLYSRTPHLDIADGIADTVRDFASLVSFSSLDTYFDYEGDGQPLDGKALEDLLAARFSTEPGFENCSLELVGSEQDDGAFYLQYGGTARSNPELPDQASYFWCRVPRQFFQENRGAYMQYVSRAIARSSFTSAYVSPALAGDFRRQNQALARRYHGLDVADPPSVSFDISDTLAGAYWLSFIGPEQCRVLGGARGLREALPASSIVDDEGDGKCRVQLGPDPELGDVNRGDVLTAYRAFAQLLEAHGLLHVPTRVTYFVDEENTASLDAQEEWHRRFLMGTDGDQT